MSYLQKHFKLEKKKVRLVKLLILIILIISTACVFFFKAFNISGSIYHNSLTAEEMKTDTDFFIKTLKANHPSMKNGQTSYNSIINNIYDKIKKPMNSEGFYWTLNTLAVALKDGHTNLKSDQINRDCIDLPTLAWTKDGLIVKENKSIFKAGDKILAIGGKTPDELLKSLDFLIPAEIPEWVKANINVISKGMYLRQQKLVDKNNNVILRYERNGKSAVVKLHLHRFRKTMYEIIHNSISYESSRNLKWRIDKANNLGIITINTCPNSKKYIKGFRNFFSSVNKNKIKNIAVDLRNNDGGSDDVINQFLSFIDVPFYLFIDNNMCYNIPQNYRDVIKNDPPLYKGSIYLLTSNSTFSAGTDFAVVLQANKIAKVIGQPAGNIPSFFGNAKEGSLSNSKFVFQYATTRYKAPVSEEEQYKAITPDYPIELSKQDIIEKRDPCLELAKKMAKSK